MMYDHAAYQARYRAEHRAEATAYRAAHREDKQAYDRAYGVRFGKPSGAQGRKMRRLRQSGLPPARMSGRLEGDYDV